MKQGPRAKPRMVIGSDLLRLTARMGQTVKQFGGSGQEATGRYIISADFQRHPSSPRSLPMRNDIQVGTGFRGRSTTPHLASRSTSMRARVVGSGDQQEVVRK